jgi:iron complex outermembrane receptor protein
MKKNVWIVPLMAIAGTASAQEAAPGQLDEVIVSADRRDENVRDVPSSVSAVSAATLDILSTGGQDVRLLASRVPSLNVESSFGRAFPRFYIRGYGNGDFRLNASQPVSLIYDEVVQENPILKGFPIFDLDQIEVLRGPQGTLFGRNTPGGVVKFDSIRPAPELGGYVNVSEATYNTANLEGAINLPRLSDELYRSARQLRVFTTDRASTPPERLLPVLRLGAHEVRARLDSGEPLLR